MFCIGRKRPVKNVLNAKRRDMARIVQIGRWTVPVLTAVLTGERRAHAGMSEARPVERPAASRETRSGP